MECSFDDEIEEFENTFKESESCSEQDCSEEDSDTDSHQLDYEILDNNNIYSGSTIKVADFALSFLVLCRRINITTTAKSILLDYIRTLLPNSNRIPASYNKLIKHLTFNSIKTTKICKTCLLESCNCDLMFQEKKLKIYEFDVSNQVRSVVRKNWELICNYKG